MNRRSLSKILNTVGLVLLIGGIAACYPRATPTPPIPEVIEDSFNLIHQVGMDADGQELDYQVDEIPDEAFTEEFIEPEPKEDEVEFEEPDRIHPLLREILERDGYLIEPVIIILRDEIRIPRLPDLPPGIPRDSPEGERAMGEAEELIEELLAQRSESTFEFLAIAEERGIGINVVEQFWLINGFIAEVELNREVVEQLLEIEQLTYVQPRFTGEEPPQDNNANNDVDDGRARIVSDPYFNLNQTWGYIGLLDSGVLSTHVLFNNPSRIDWVRDCVNGGARCNNNNDPDWNPDDYVDHGTSSAAIIVANNRLGNAYRGVTGILLDSWKIYGHGRYGILDSAAAVRAFQRAVASMNRIIVGEIQAKEGENGAIALAADGAYDAGAIVIAANGNYGPDAKSVASPGLAHKAIGVGAYNVVSQAVPDYQGRGPAPDGRYKPDLQAPNESETASTVGDKALRTFGGTSGSTPYVAGAAALTRNWLISHNTWDNGQVYVCLINSGTLASPNFGNTKGLGPLRMPTNGIVWWGKVSVNQGTVINIPIKIASNRSNLRAALWWPESQTERHDDIDLHLIDPNDVERANSESGVSIFERAQVSASLTQGTWTVRIKGYNVKSGPQTVYWTAAVHH